jgi:hypothetical protein
MRFLSGTYWDGEYWQDDGVEATPEQQAAQQAAQAQADVMNAWVSEHWQEGYDAQKALYPSISEMDLELKVRNSLIRRYVTEVQGITIDYGPDVAMSTGLNPSPGSIEFFAADRVYSDLMDRPEPNAFVTFDDAPQYGDLPDSDVVLWGNNPWPIYNPRPRFVKVDNVVWLSYGQPTCQRDPWEFLRCALMEQNWKAIEYWYAFWIKNAWDAGHAELGPFHQISQVNLAEFKYSTFNDPGGIRYYTGFSYNELGAFLRHVWSKFLPYQSETNSGILGGLGYNGLSPFSYLRPMADGKAMRVEYAGAWFANYHHAVSLLRLGWVPDSSVSGLDYLPTVVMAIILAVATAGIGSAISGALAPAAGGTAGGVAGGTAAGVVGGTTGGAAGATLTTTALLPEIIVTGTVSTIGAGSVAAGIAAGTIAGAAASPILNSTTLLPEITVTAPTAPVVSVADALAAGAVSTTTVAPAISSNTTTSPDAVQSTDTLQEFVVTAQPAAPVTVADLIASGAITATAAQPVINSTTTLEEVTVSAPSQPSLPEISMPDLIAGAAAAITATEPTFEVEGEPGEKTWSDRLQELIKQYGADYVQQHLAELLADWLGHSPTPTQLDDAHTELKSALNLWPWLIGFGLLAAVVIGTRDKQKPGHAKGKK